MIPKNMHKFVA